MFRKKYNHKAEDIFRACGIDSERIKKKLFELNDYIKIINNSKESYKSLVVKKMEQMFTKRELATLTYLYGVYAKELDFKKQQDYSPEIA